MMACLPTVNNVSVPAKDRKIVDQMYNISSKEEFDPLKVLSPILQHTNFNFFTVKVTKINNFPEHPHLNYSISFNDAARLMLSKFHPLLDIQVFKCWSSWILYGAGSAGSYDAVEGAASMFKVI
jgi:hypothetical protein